MRISLARYLIYRLVASASLLPCTSLVAGVRKGELDLGGLVVSGTPAYNTAPQ